MNTSRCDFCRHKRIAKYIFMQKTTYTNSENIIVNMCADCYPKYIGKLDSSYMLLRTIGPPIIYK